MLTAFLLQLSKAFFFQQCTVVDNSNIVSQQGNLLKNVTGNQNRFSSCVKLDALNAKLNDANAENDRLKNLLNNQKPVEDKAVKEPSVRHGICSDPQT